MADQEKRDRLLAAADGEMQDSMPGNPPQYDTTLHDVALGIADLTHAVRALVLTMQALAIPADTSITLVEREDVP